MARKQRPPINDAESWGYEPGKEVNRAELRLGEPAARSSSADGDQLPVPAREPAPSGLGPLRKSSLLETFFAGLSPRTLKAYREDLGRIAAWLKLPSVEALTVALVGDGVESRAREHAGRANQMLEDFKAWAKDQEWSPSYVNNHLAAVRSLVTLARRVGAIVWTIDVKDLKTKTLRDTRGPGFEGLLAIIDVASAQANPRIAARDEAIVTLLATMALRRREVVTLDREHLDMAGRRLMVLRKGRTERVPITVPEAAAAALARWLAARGEDPGSLFTSFPVLSAVQRPDRRLAESSLWEMVVRHARKAGYKTWPHGLRHAAITEALERTNGNLREVQAFSGHVNPAMVMRYDDNRQDLGGKVANVLGDAVAEGLARLRAVEKEGTP